MRLVGSERRALRVLDEIIALRGELPQNIWTIGSFVSRDKAVSRHQLARDVVSNVPDTTTPLPTGIAINGAKDHLYLGTETPVENTAPEPQGHIL